MTPLDTTIAYKVSLLLLFHSDFWYNSLGSTCTCHYLLVGECKSIKVAMSLSQACYSQLGPWPKLEHTP